MDEGVQKVTFYKLLERAKYSKKGTEAREFYEAVIRAEAEVEAEMIKRWRDKTDEDWKAAMHYLARRFPDRWSANRKSGGIHRGGGEDVPDEGCLSVP